MPQMLHQFLFSKDFAPVSFQGASQFMKQTLPMVSHHLMYDVYTAY